MENKFKTDHDGVFLCCCTLFFIVFVNFLLNNSKILCNAVFHKLIKAKSIKSDLLILEM